MAATVVQSKSYHNLDDEAFGGAAFNLTLDAALTVGNAVVVMAFCNNADDPFTVSDGGSNSYDSYLVSDDPYGDGFTSGLAVCKNVTSATSTITVTRTGTSQNIGGLYVWEVTGQDTGTNPDATPVRQFQNGRNTTTDHLSSGNVTTVTDGCLILGCAMIFFGSPSNISAGTDYTETAADGVHPGRVCGEQRTQTSAGAIAATFTLASGSGIECGTFVVPIRPAAGGGGNANLLVGKFGALLKGKLS